MSTTRIMPPRRSWASRCTALLVVAAALLAGLAGCGRAAPGPAGADNGHTVCLAPGARIEVYLHGSATAPWSPIQLDGAALRPVASGKGALARDITAGFFAAATAGTARLSPSRPACPSASPGAVRCGAEQAFQVEVTVH